MNNRDIIIWLNSLKNITNNAIEKLIKYYGDIYGIWVSSSNEIENLNFISENLKKQIVEYRNQTYFDNLMEKMIKEKIDIVTILDEEYPEKLKYIYDNPKVLYIKGQRLRNEENILAVVGSRKATPYGIHTTNMITNRLLELGITPISGMAKGIDTEVHRTSVMKEKRNIAVLGCGVDIIYPKSNKYIYDRIIENGTVVSEFSLGTEPLRHNFPMRNRIISGLSEGVVVVEANEKSGSLITAHHAAEQGKEVFAIPGNIDSIYSKGTNLLIRDGAKMVLSIEDIIEEIREFRNLKTIKKEVDIDYSKFSEDEKKVISHIANGPMHTDLICANTGISISNINGILTILEMKGIVKRLPNQFFTII